MRFQDMNWMDIEGYLETDHRLILVVGATKQHAYLSVMTSVLIPEKIALAAAEREQVMVAPALNFGVIGTFTDFPGTLGLTPETFNLVLSELVENLLYQRFTRFLIMNGSLQNRLPPRLEELQAEGALQIEWYDWWRSPVLEAFAAQHGLIADHGNWSESFPFTRVGKAPDTSKAYVNLDYLEAGSNIRDVLGDGSYGGPYQIDDARMIELFDLLVDEVANIVRGMKDS